MALHDYKGHVTPHIIHLDLRIAVMTYMMPLLLLHADNNACGMI